MKALITLRQEGLHQNMVPSFGGYEVETENGKSLSFDFQDMCGYRVLDEGFFRAEQSYLDLDVYKSEWLVNGFISDTDTDEIIIDKIFNLIKDSKSSTELYYEVWDNDSDSYTEEPSGFLQLDIVHNAQSVSLLGKVGNL